MYRTGALGKSLGYGGGREDGRKERAADAGMRDRVMSLGGRVMEDWDDHSAFAVP